jgi:hypothetical protein
MKSTTSLELKKSILIALLLIFSIGIFAQTTYKVVCDKKSKTVKIVESDNRSPNYVPIKSGFPFRQVAQKWIDNNYSTTACNPIEITKQIQAEQNGASPTTPTSTNSNNQNTQPQSTTTILQPKMAAANSTTKYSNSSFIVNAKFSTLGKVFSSEKKLTPGLNVGLEQLFGQKSYIGIGAYLDLFFAEFSPINSFDKMTFFYAKIPVFFGQRIYKKNLLIMYEAGAEFNTKIIADDEDFEIPGQTFKGSSFNLMTRLRVGSEKIQLTLGAEMWVSEIIENDSFKMSVLYFGLRFSF